MEMNAGRTFYNFVQFFVGFFVILCNFLYLLKKFFEMIEF